MHPKQSYELYEDHYMIRSNDGPKAPFWGGDIAVNIVRQFLSAQSDFIFSQLDQTRESRTKMFKIALKLMYTHAWVFDSTLKYSHLSFRSHAEAFLATTSHQDTIEKYLKISI